ncbi:MAG: hypothetical protein KAG97_10535 [Victivallales bacterium]|nr:hypothetical protein [Victivallales bacterium]
MKSRLFHLTREITTPVKAVIAALKTAMKNTAAPINGVKKEKHIKATKRRRKKSGFLNPPA